MRGLRFFLPCLLLCLLLAAPVMAEEGVLATTPARFRTSYETIELPGAETMGLLGGSFLFDHNDWLAIGGSSYGALTGERGGFITLGLAAEVRKQLFEAAEINAGLFVGGGGGRGGYTLQGGGLMLRGHLATQVQTGLGNFGLGLSYVSFPNGNIESLQPFISYEYPFRTLLTSGWFTPPALQYASSHPLATSEQEFSLVFRHYEIPAEVRNDSGGRQYPTLDLLGVEWQRFLDDTKFIKIESAGAMGGQSNGYMQILLGAGGRLQLTRSAAVKLSASVGVAGGGGVATGGGLLLDAALALQQNLGKRLYVEIATAYTAAPDGNFKAPSVSAKLGGWFLTPKARQASIPKGYLSNFIPQNFRIRTVQQSYFQAATGWRNHHPEQNVNLLGFQLDNFLNDYLYLSGQGIAAYQGQAGGYMTGLVGGGTHLPLFASPLFLELEALVGAAGGGGLDVAGGLVWQSNAGLGYRLSDSYSILASGGYMSAPKGNFRAKVFSLALTYRFSFFTEK